MPCKKFTFVAMASPCVMHIVSRDELVAELAASVAIDEVRRIERRYSRYRPDSELSRINEVAQAGGETEVDAETAALFDFAFEAHDKSGGLFDITSGLLRRAWNFGSRALPAAADLHALLARVGLRHVIWRNPVVAFSRPGVGIDFGGIGKEYAVDRSVAVLREFGITSGLVDLGGDIGVVGPHPDGTPWSIGIAHPRRAKEVMLSVSMADGGLASSGDYERFMEIDGTRYCHILDPRTGMSCQGLMAVSVVASNCLAAGAIATSAMLKGRDGPSWLAGLGLPHFYVDDEGAAGGTLAPVRN